MPVSVVKHDVMNNKHINSAIIVKRFIILPIAIDWLVEFFAEAKATFSVYQYPAGKFLARWCGARLAKTQNMFSTSGFLLRNCVKHRFVHKLEVFRIVSTESGAICTESGFPSKVVIERLRV